MKQKWITWTYFFITLVLFGVAIYLQQTYNRTSLDFNKFEKTLHKKENFTLNQLNNLVNQLKLHKFREINSIIFFDSADYQNFSHNDIYFAIYDMDTLKFWTSNQLNLPLIFDHTFAMRINKIGNSWFEILIKNTGTYRIIGLIKIKDEYPFSNKYLKPRFAKNFDLPAQVKISLIPLSFGHDIKGFDGQYVFTLVPPPMVKVQNKVPQNVVLSLLILGYLFLLLFLAQAMRNTRLFGFSVFVILLVAVRILMLIYRFPPQLYALSLFKPVLFSYSVGDLIIDVGLVTFIFALLLKKVQYYDIRPESANITFDIISFAVVTTTIFSLIFLIFDFFIQFIIHWKIIELQRIFSLDFVSFWAILASGFSFIVLFYVFYKSVLLFKKYLTNRLIFIVTFVVYLVIFGLNIVFGGVDYWGKLWILLAVFILFLFGIKHELGISYLMLIIAALSALISTSIIFYSNDKKLALEAKKVANRVENLRDAVAEQLIRELEPKLLNDQILADYLTKTASLNLQNKIQHYLLKEYFQGYWKKYNIKIVLCGNSTQLPSSQDKQACANNYGNLIIKYGHRLSKTANFINKKDGTVVYLIYLKNHENDIYIELSPKIMPKEIGYPELLLDTIIENPIPDRFSYAKYLNNRLIYKYGEFKYSVNGKFFAKHLNQYIHYDQFEHYIKQLDSPHNFIVTSYKTLSVLDLIITFSYLFVFYILLQILILVISGPVLQTQPVKSWTIKNKLIISMIGVLTIAFLSLGIVTVWFNIGKFKQQFNQYVIHKLHSAATAIELISDTSRVENPNLNKQLKQIAQVLNTDINLYNYRGILLGTSRPKIFDNQLLGQFINHNALYYTLVKQQNDFITQEQIGLLNYTSGYSSIQTQTGQTLFINIPFFSNPNQLHEQISNLIVTLLNIYIILFILTVTIAVIISEQVTTPIKIIQQKFQRLKLGHKYEKIDYNRNDEIGQLVDEYNKMVDKLEQSVDLLAKTERESAWREMAKQIAHEIKNPLTPMKLSIQLLQKAWENKDKNFDKRLKDVTKTLIEQIENLRNIAEEFSAFAKMPVSNNEKIDLAQKIENITKLFENIENVQVKAIIKQRPVYIWADNKQISRVFINLIKNAIQAIPEGIEGKVIIELDADKDKALVKVIDNGTGIPQDIQSKLFTPSFTTKSSGMGLGLAMVKNIIQNAKGKIWFETEVGKGTTFYIEFPLYKEPEDEQDKELEK